MHNLIKRYWLPAALASEVLSRHARQRGLGAKRENNWLQDREAMRQGESFSGLPRFIPEDVAMTESMGPVYRREYECLLNADLGVAPMRQTLIHNAERMARGEHPAGLGRSTIPAGLQTLVTDEKPWRTFMTREQALSA